MKKAIVFLFLVFLNYGIAFSQNYEIKNVKIDYNGTCAAFVTLDIYTYGKFDRKAEFCVNKSSDYYNMYWELGNAVYQPKYNSLDISSRNLAFNNINSIDKAVECYLNAWLKNANATRSNSNSNSTSNNTQTTTEDKSYLNFTAGSQFNSSLTYGSFKDTRNGKTYKTIKIGTQTWMAENLAYKPSSGNYWAYDNNSSNVAKYGYLYDWETAKKVCPAGWHLPSDAEWTTLTSSLGGESYAGGKLKSKVGYKPDVDGAATNESGFSALPGGYRGNSGTFGNFGNYGLWWSATDYDTDYAWYRGVNYDTSNVTRSGNYKEVGFSVRCVRD